MAPFQRSVSPSWWLVFSAPHLEGVFVWRTSSPRTCRTMWLGLRRGGEIGRAHALQAKLYGLTPDTSFSPMPLKPQTDRSIGHLTKYSYTSLILRPQYLSRRYKTPPPHYYTPGEQSGILTRSQHKRYSQGGVQVPTGGNHNNMTMMGHRHVCSPRALLREQEDEQIRLDSGADSNSLVMRLRVSTGQVLFLSSLVCPVVFHPT